MKIKPCPVCEKPPEITIGPEGKTASCVNKQCWLHGFYVPTAQWNKRAARKLPPKDWENLAEGAMSAGCKVAAKGARKNNAPFEAYEDSRWDLLKSYQKSGWIAAAKFIARKLK